MINSKRIGVVIPRDKCSERVFLRSGGVGTFARRVGTRPDALSSVFDVPTAARKDFFGSAARWDRRFRLPVAMWAG
jgi:hypothetical protein